MDVLLTMSFRLKLGRAKNVRKVLNRRSVVTAIISVSVFQASFILNVHGIEIGHGIIIEDLGLLFAFGRFEISKKIGI